MHLNWYKEEWNNPLYSLSFIESLYFCNWLVILFFLCLNYYWFYLLMKMVIRQIFKKESKIEKDNNKNK